MTARRLPLLLLALLACSAAAHAQALQPYIEKEKYIVTPDSKPQGLDVLEVYADLPGKHPLVVLTHGTSKIESENQHYNPWTQLPQALWFARRGYVAIVVTRRGFGRSGGAIRPKEASCSSGGYKEIGQWSAEDLKAVIKTAQTFPEVDASTVISAGTSTGGFAQVALSADPPPELKAALNFAGGIGGNGAEGICTLSGVTDDFAHFGKEAHKHGSVPMLWVYSQSDEWFTPAMVSQFKAAYDKAGGNEQFFSAPPFHGNDGHHLYYFPGEWPEDIAAFLKAHDLLPLGDTVLADPEPPHIAPPVPLQPSGMAGWNRFLMNGSFGAFAMAGSHIWGVSYTQFDQATADQVALDHCNQAVDRAKATDATNSCTIIARTPQAPSPGKLK